MINRLNIKIFFHIFFIDLNNILNPLISDSGDDPIYLPATQAFILFPTHLDPGATKAPLQYVLPPQV